MSREAGNDEKEAARIKKDRERLIFVKTKGWEPSFKSQILFLLLNTCSVTQVFGGGKSIDVVKNEAC